MLGLLSDEDSTGEKNQKSADFVQKLPRRALHSPGEGEQISIALLNNSRTLIFEFQVLIALELEKNGF